MFLHLFLFLALALAPTFTLTLAFTLTFALRIISEVIIRPPIKLALDSKQMLIWLDLIPDLSSGRSYSSMCFAPIKIDKVWHI